jgi:two-component system response regulator
MDRIDTERGQIEPLGINDIFESPPALENKNMVDRKGNAVVILMAEDDADDRLLSLEALREARLRNELRFVEDGEELVEYLTRSGRYRNPADAPRPGLILLDLNMPRKDGREALQEIKAIKDLRCIPIVVLTTSKAEEDILRSYDLGVSGYITKPVRFAELIEVMQTLGKYWFEIVELPSS